MYKVGDHIVYPMHGAGIIRAIEEKEILDNRQMYYDVHILSENMEILIPTEKAEEIGVRRTVTPEELTAILVGLVGPMDKMDINWNRRCQENMERLKTGKLGEAVWVVRNLTLLERQKGLSTGEKKLLTSARNFLASEMVMVKDIDKDQAIKIIENTIE